MSKSVEEKVEDIFKKQLNEFNIKYYTKTESINEAIDSSLKNSVSKSGGSGNNYPDIKILLESSNMRRIPVMIEAKGTFGKLVKMTSDGDIELVTYNKNGDANYSSIQGYAVNGAVHYVNAILDGDCYNEGIAIGINGYEKNDNMYTELDAYYISEKNNRVPKKIGSFNDMSFLKTANINNLCEMLDKLVLTEEELDRITKKVEATLEQKIKSIHQNIYDNKLITLETNEKLYLFCGLIMAGIHTKGVSPLTADQLTGSDNPEYNDGTIIINHINAFLNSKNMDNSKKEMIQKLLFPIFKNTLLYKPKNGESILKMLYRQVNNDIIPCLESNLHLDFTGKILNSLSDWVHIENDKSNDVVLTPRYVTHLMAKLARTNKDSYVWDSAMGSAGFLVSAMNIMIADAQNTIKDIDRLNEKITNIKKNQLLGVEILGNIYMLAVLNMILMGDGCSNIINDDSFSFKTDFPANVFLLNPPYSADGKGFNFVDAALSKMHDGYGCILIQENAGSGMGHPYTESILKHSTLKASIHMSNIFCGKAGVQTAIYLFKVGRPHEEDDIVTFVDFSNDGYSRQSKKKSSQDVNLKNTDHALERYAELEAIILDKKKNTNYYNEENGLVIKDTISLSGEDWTYSQHKKVNTKPSELDFKKTVSEYISWKVSNLIKDV
ncbi:MAG: restriction endonuclease subunit M [Firmicutes bacterium]|nr:restriction endonuclease subunit M [Bacillota bacterium]